MNIYPWQQQQWQTLSAQIEQGRLPHALLLAGPKGMGKVAFARVVAARLLCEHTSFDFCGVCRGCQLFSAGSHPDYDEIVPEEKSTIIKVDQIRRLIDRINLTSQREGYQVVIIHPTQAMNRAASNALLKTLEEPSGKVVLLLVSDQIGSIPATILSRCQKIDFPGRENDMALNWITENVSSQIDPQILLRLVEYAPLRAAEFVNNGYFALRERLMKYLFAVNQNGVSIAFVSELVKEDMAMLYPIFISLALDILRLHLGVQERHLVNRDKTTQLQMLVKNIERLPLLEFLKTLVETQQLLQSSMNINIQLSLENSILEWRKLIGTGIVIMENI